jgi:hypothetical protein
MTDMREEAGRLLKEMSDRDREKALKTLFLLQEVKTKREAEILMQQLQGEEKILEFIAVMSLGVMEHSFIKKEQQKLSENAAIVRADALQILNALIQAHPTVDDKVLVRRAIEMARQLRDTF